MQRRCCVLRRLMRKSTKLASVYVAETWASAYRVR